MPDIVNDDDLSALAAEYVLGTLEPDERTRANVLLDVDHGFRGLVRVWERRLGELHLMVEPVEPDARIWERIRSKVGVPQPSPSITPLAPSTPREPPELPEVPREAAPSTHEQKLTELMLEVEKFSERRSPEPPPPVEPEPAEPAPAVAEPEELRLPERVSRELTPAVLLPPATVREPRPKTPGRGWRAYALVMTLVAFGLGGLIASWRFIPDRLPLLLRPIAFLRLVEIPAPPPKKPPPPGFDE